MSFDINTSEIKIDALNPYRRERNEMYKKIQKVDDMVEHLISFPSNSYGMSYTRERVLGNESITGDVSVTTIYPSLLINHLREEIGRHITEKIPFYGFSISDDNVYQHRGDKFLTCSCGRDWLINDFCKIRVFEYDFIEFIGHLNWAWKIKVKETIGVNGRIFKNDLEKVKKEIEKSKKEHKSIFEGIKL